MILDRVVWTVLGITSILTLVFFEGMQFGSKKTEKFLMGETGYTCTAYIR